MPTRRILRPWTTQPPSVTGVNLAHPSTTDLLFLFNGATGVNSVDYSGHPDCRSGYLEAMEKVANLATKMGTELNTHISIIAPLSNMKKSEIIKTGNNKKKMTLKNLAVFMVGCIDVYFRANLQN